MNIEIKIIADSVEEARAAFAKLAGPTFRVTDAPAITQGGELTIPAGTDLKIAEVTRNSVTLTSDPTQEPMKAPEPERPKRTRMSKQAAELAAESPQDAPSEPEAPQAATTPAEPEKPAEEPVEAAETKWETVKTPTPTLDEIATAGARLLDADASKMMPLLDLLREFGVQAITQLKDDQLAAFAERLRGLGAEIDDGIPF